MIPKKLSSVLMLFIAAGGLLCERAPARANKKQPLIPYGADHITDTDTEKLKQSLLDQMRAARIRLPKIYDLFPDKYTKPAATDGVNVMGASPDDLNDVSGAFNFSFPQLKPCESLVMQKPFLKWQVFTALHETVHYVVLQMGKLEGLLPSIRPPGTTALDMALAENRAHETIADLGALLYIFSNYGDLAENKRLAENLSDLRQSNFMDLKHDSAFSVREKGEFLRHVSSQKLTIVNAAKMAVTQTSIVPTNEDDLLTRALVLSQGIDPIRRQMFNELPAERKVQVVNSIRGIQDARNRTCGIAPR